MLIHKTNFLMRALYPDLIWRMPNEEKAIYLTFDDGPIPEITEFVLEELAKFKAKATFFCIGGNIEKHPDIFQMLVNQGHSIGNHTFNHVRGWDVENDFYLDNFRKCDEEIYQQLPSLRSKIQIPLFRPPFGRIKRSQAKEILKTHKIIMWDVLTGDYDQSLSKERVLSKILQHTKQGSIVLFHDSIKASKNMIYALPKVLEHFSEQGFTFKSL